MPDRYVVVYRRAGRWTWRVVENEDSVENGPAYASRVEAVIAAVNIFPENRIEVEER